MRLLRAASTLCALAPLAACGTSFDAMTGGDGGRGDAVELQLGVLAWDRLDAEAGDHTDWKRVELDSPGKLRVRAWTFEPRAFRARLELCDERGAVVSTLKLSERLQELSTDELAAGSWFLRVATSDGASDYGLEVTVGPAKPAKRAPVLD